MGITLLNTFIEETLHVLPSRAFTNARGGKPYLKKDFSTMRMETILEAN